MASILRKGASKRGKDKGKPDTEVSEQRKSARLRSFRACENRDEEQGNGDEIIEDEFGCLVKELGQLRRVALVDNCARLQSMENGTITCKLTESNGINATNPTNYLELTLYLREEGDSWATVEQVLCRTEDLLRRAPEHIHGLYAYRSLAKAMPLIQAHHSESRKQDFYRKSFQVLRPEIEKISKLREFHEEVIEAFRMILEKISTKKEHISQILFDVLVRLFDIVIVLDYFKDIKPCLQNDFSFYKRALHMVKADLGSMRYERLSKEQELVQMFLSDPRCPKGSMVQGLLEKIQSLRNTMQSLAELLTWCVNRIRAHDYLFPEKKWQLLRVCLYLVFLLDSSNDEKDTPFNFFKAKKLMNTDTLKHLKLILKQNPVVPVHADVQLRTSLVLRRCPHFEPSVLESYYTEPSDPKAAALFDLTVFWQEIRNCYDQYLSKFTGLMHRIRSNAACQQLQRPEFSRKDLSASSSPELPLDVEIAEAAFESVWEGLHLLSEWRDRVISFIAFKFASPAKEAALQSAGVDLSHAGLEYDRVVRANYSNSELMVLIDVLGMIKSLARIVHSEEALLQPLLRVDIYEQLQRFLSREPSEMLGKADSKTKKALKEALVLLRHFAAEDPAFQDQYRARPSNGQPHQLPTPSKKKKGFFKSSDTSAEGSGTSCNIARSRCVTPSFSQLQLIASIVSSVLGENIEGKQNKGLIRFKASSGSSAQKEDPRADLERFLHVMRNVTSISDLFATLDALSEMGMLWYREFYLDITKSAQFPIEMSLPWILTKEILENPSSNLTNSVFFALDVYNDAAQRALTDYNQQYLFDEIEAEVNLVMEQLLYLLPTHIYSHFKAIAAYEELEASYRSKIEKLKHNSLSQVEAQMYNLLSNQARLHILGRNIDLAGLISHRLSEIVEEDIEAAISKFESGSIKDILQFESHLAVLRRTHEEITKQIPELRMESFELFLRDVDGSSDLQPLCGRIASHISSSVIIDIFPKYVYNMTTGRLVIPGDPEGSSIRRPQPRLQGSHLLYGRDASRWYELMHRRERGYIGSKHMDAMIRLLGRRGVGALVESVMDDLEVRLLEGIGPLADILRMKMPTMRLPALSNNILSCCDEFEALLGPLFGTAEIKTDVLNAFREFGNALVFVHLINESFERAETMHFHVMAPLKGFNRVADIGKGSDCQSSVPSEINRSTPIMRNILMNLEGMTKSDVPEGISKLWSSLKFFLADPEKDLIEEFGDGVCWAGAALVLLSGEKASYERQDYCIHVLRIHRFQRNSRAKNDAARIGRFVTKATYLERTCDMAEALLTGYFSPKKNIPVAFHPPKPLVQPKKARKGKIAPQTPRSERSGDDEISEVKKPKHIRRNTRTTAA